MAQTRRSTPRISTGKGNDIVVVNSPAAPARRSSRRRPSIRRRVRRGARRASAAYSGASTRSQMTSLALGGFGVGFIERNWGDKIPTLPVVGRKGALALGIALLNPKNAIIRDVGKAAAAIAGYELGATGGITGDYEDPYVGDGWVDDEDDYEDEYDDEVDGDDFLTT